MKRTVHIISRTPKSNKAQVVIHTVGDDGKKTSQTKHVELNSETGQVYLSRKVEERGTVDSKPSVRFVVEEVLEVT